MLIKTNRFFGLQGAEMRCYVDKRPLHPADLLESTHVSSIQHRGFPATQIFSVFQCRTKKSIYSVYSL